MTVYVIDASVASRFLLVEEFSDRAELVLNDFIAGSSDLKAPKLITFEVGNTLWKAVKQGLINLDEAMQKLSYFLELRIDSIELTEEDYKETLIWSTKTEATYYDSVYVKATKKIGALLLTADDTLYEKACREVPTLHLKDYRSKR